MAFTVRRTKKQGMLRSARESSFLLWAAKTTGTTTTGMSIT